MDLRQEAMGYEIAPGTDGVRRLGAKLPYLHLQGKAAAWACSSQTGPQPSGPALAATYALQCACLS